MNSTEVLQSLEKWTSHYIEELDNYSDEQLGRKPAEDAWSLGQMYVHLIETANHLQLANVDKCRALSEEAVLSAAEMPVKNEAGEAVFAMGGFPPVRIVVPASARPDPAQAESKRQLVEGLQAVLRRAGELEPQLGSIPAHVKVAHPRLGGMNAEEWFALVEMHYRHHLLQKERLHAFIAG